MNMIKRATVSLPGDDSGNVANTQVTYLGRTAQVEVIYPYGTAGKAPKDSSSVMLNIQAQEENRVIIEYRPADRFKNLKPGEYVVGNQLTGAFVKFSENSDIEIITDGDIKATCKNAEITATTKATITAPAIALIGNVAITGNLAVSGTMTNAGKDVGQGHGHTQGNDSNGDSEAAISGVT
jgi:phage gp45-like